MKLSILQINACARWRCSTSLSLSLFFFCCFAPVFFPFCLSRFQALALASGRFSSFSRLSVCLSVSVSFSLCVSLSVSLCVCLSVSVSLSLPLPLSLSLPPSLPPSLSTRSFSETQNADSYNRKFRVCSSRCITLMVQAFHFTE